MKSIPQTDSGYEVYHRHGYFQKERVIGMVSVVAFATLLIAIGALAYMNSTQGSVGYDFAVSTLVIGSVGASLDIMFFVFSVKQRCTFVKESNAKLKEIEKPFDGLTKRSGRAFKFDSQLTGYRFYYVKNDPNYEVHIYPSPSSRADKFTTSLCGSGYTNMVTGSIRS
ncbi:MAG: hypothetical protein K940chlam9_00533 [Chlamydiae bacterium]|nr:hypothetical protein [Chlamydiota bacterium]